MGYTGNDGRSGAVVAGNSGRAADAANVGRVTGLLLIAAAVLTVAMFFLPVMTFHLHSLDIYVWRSASYGGVGRAYDFISAIPYALMVIAAGLIGVLLALGMGARRGVLFWAASFAAGLVLQIASGNVMGYAQGFDDDNSPGPGYWVITVVMLVALAALVMGLRDAVAAKRGAVQEQGRTVAGGAADRVAGVFLVVGAVFEFLRSFQSLVSHDSSFATVWKAGGDGSLPLLAAHFALGLIVVLVVAISLLAGGGVRNPALRAASGAAAAILVATGISDLSFVVSVMGPNFWEYAGTGFYLAVFTLLLSFAATVAGMVAQLAKPRLPARPGFAPGFMPPGAMPAGPVGQPNPFAPVSSSPNPFAQGVSAPNPFPPAPPNPFAPAAPPANPFAQPQAEATVKIDPVPAQPPRMAKVYDGKDADGRPVADRPAVEGNTRVAVLAYLESAPIVLAARSFEQDEFTPADRDVPLNFRTDGTWVWAGAVAHYLHKHGLPPEAELVRHISSRGFRVGDVSEAAKDAAVRVITGG